VGDDEGFTLDPQLLALLATLLNYLGLFLALALFARFLGRPLISALTANAGAALPVRAGELEAQLAGSIAPPAPSASLAQQVSAIADRRSEDSVKILRGWLDQQE
jgi:flagellar biosynthesis/type III secretory pathway M-ring protein FliF/YscJ